MSNGPWFTLRPDRWTIEQKIANERLVSVKCETDEDGVATITGEFMVHLSDGPSYGPFTLRLVYPANFPERSSAPKVFLLQNPYGWENVLDSHIEESWRLCLGVPAEMKIDFRSDGSLEKLLEAVGLFLFLQLHFQRDLATERSGGPKAVWPGPERPHGHPGMMQAIKGWKLSRDGNRGCACGSGFKFKECCGPKLREKGFI